MSSYNAPIMHYSYIHTHLWAKDMVSLNENVYLEFRIRALHVK